MAASSSNISSQNINDVVELGFIESAPSWLLKSKFFRCKVGGKPSWLSLENLPDVCSLTCKICKKPCSLLIQVYAPVDDVEDAFHRSIFLFMCMDGKCCNRFDASNFVAFRSQLPRKNKYYYFEPPVEEEKGCDEPSAASYGPVCSLCGFRSELTCDKCEKRYCSEAHKTLDQQTGHAKECQSEPGAVANSQGKKKKKKSRAKCLLPEYELVTDTEELPSTEKEKSDSEKMKEYEAFLKTSKAKTCVSDDRFDDAEKYIKKSDKLFNKFKKRVSFEPDQVLRYQRMGEPLLVSSEHQPSNKDIPDCSCGAKRMFEFQVMPQLLNHLSLDDVRESVDWGTLLVYTCSKSCNLGTEAYAQEFVWKQDFSEDQD